MSTYCTTCGTRRAEEAKYCALCEAAFKDENAATRTPRTSDSAPGYGTGWFVGATVVLAAIVTGAILGGNALLGRFLAGPEAVAQSQYLTPDGRITSGPTEPAGTPVESWPPSPTEDEITDSPSVLPEPSQPAVSTAPVIGNDLISVEPAAAQDPAAVDVVRLLTAYFTAINSHDYDSYQAQQTRAARATTTRKEFASGYRSTVDSQIKLLSLTTAADGRLLADVSFISTQNAEDGPDGQACTHWTVGKFLEGQGTSLRIGRALSGHSSHKAC
ncbi:MAG TPA: hypothetical protein VFH76_18105 [Kribbella sp.]|nr:hypothetical protein [Kribbella sp.]